MMTNMSKATVEETIQNLSDLNLSGSKLLRESFVHGQLQEWIDNGESNDIFAEYQQFLNENA